MPRKRRLLVVDPSISWPEEDGVREIVGGWPGEHVVLRPALRPGDGPAPDLGYDFDAAVVMGSRASVNDDLPWLADLAAWLGPLLDGTHARPVLGICFGHQLVARCLGGKVSRMRPDRSEERGVKESFFEPCSLSPGGGRLKVIVSHGETVVEVPAGVRVVAQREGVAVDALEHDSLPVFSVQFHPEARATFLDLREIPAGPDDALAFEDQARLLAQFRAVASRFG